MTKKESFAKLTEGLDKLNEEQIEKSEDTEAKTQSNVDVVEAPSSVQEPEFVQAPADKIQAENAEDEEKKKDEEEEAAKEDESKDEESKDEEPKEEEDKEAEEPEEEESKDEEPKDEKAELDAQEAVKPETEAVNAEEESKEEVEKSASEEGLTEADIVGAFEAVTKSYGVVLKELQELRQYVTENISKSEKEADQEAAPEVDKPVAEKPESEKAKEQEAEKEEDQDEEVEKSAKDEENVEGKSVDYVSKSNGIPEVTVEDGEAPEEEAEFNAREHVGDVVNYYTSSSVTLSQGQKSAYRAAVQRVKRNEATIDDVNLFRQVVEKK